MRKLSLLMIVMMIWLVVIPAVISDTHFSSSSAQIVFQSLEEEEIKRGVEKVKAHLNIVKRKVQQAVALVKEKRTLEASRILADILNELKELNERASSLKEAKKRIKPPAVVPPPKVEPPVKKVPALSPDDAKFVSEYLKRFAVAEKSMASLRNVVSALPDSPNKKNALLLLDKLNNDFKQFTEWAAGLQASPPKFPPYHQQRYDWYMQLLEQNAKTAGLVEDRIKQVTKAPPPVAPPIVVAPPKLFVEKTPVAAPPPTPAPEPKTCAQECQERGLLPGPLPDFTQYILNYVNANGRCKESAQAILPDQTILKFNQRKCICHKAGQPVITISPKQAVCRNTPCGDVPCDGQKTCGRITVKCNWGGWTKVGDQYRPLIKPEGKEEAAPPAKQPMQASTPKLSNVQVTGGNGQARLIFPQVVRIVPYAVLTVTSEKKTELKERVEDSFAKLSNVQKLVEEGELDAVEEQLMELNEMLEELESELGVSEAPAIQGKAVQQIPRRWWVPERPPEPFIKKFFRSVGNFFASLFS